MNGNLIKGTMIAGIMLSQATYAEYPNDYAHGPFPLANSRPATWVTTDDYPMEALRLEAQGRTAFRVSVSKDGAPTGCSIVQSSGSKELDDRTCEMLMLRARFTPGTDAAGDAIEGGYRASVVWRLPADPPPADQAQPVRTDPNGSPHG